MKKLNILLFTLVMSLLSIDGIGQSNTEKETKKEKIVLQAFKPTIAVHGRVQADIEYQKINDKDKTGFEFRRLYLSASGNIFTNLKYKAQIEFAHGGVGFRDVYIKAVDLPYIGGNFVVGNYANPTGLNMATSSKYITFLERALVTNTQGFRWAPGFFYENFSLLDGKLTTQFAYTFNGDKKKGFTDDLTNMGTNFTARITGVPYKNGNNFIHLGINYEFVNSTKNAYAFHVRPETHMFTKMKLDIADVKGQNDIGAELATVFGPFSFQGEYERSMVATKLNGNYNLDTYYGTVSFFLTKGDHRSYKNAAFGRTKPKNAIAWNKKDGFYGGLGAIELAVRYSSSNFSDRDLTASFDGNTVDHSMNNITAGINWYLNAHTRFMYNYVKSFTGDNTFDAHTVRFAVDF